MLAELLEQDLRQQSWPGAAARDHMEGRGRLADPLAVPAGELLAHMLDHLPLARTTSSVSVTSSPILRSTPPQQGQAAAAG